MSFKKPVVSFPIPHTFNLFVTFSFVSNFLSKNTLTLKIKTPLFMDLSIPDDPVHQSRASWKMF